jgi:hypothetical protein
MSFEDILKKMKRNNTIYEELNDDINAVVQATGDSRIEVVILTKRFVDNYTSKGMSLTRAIDQVRSELRLISSMVHFSAPHSPRIQSMSSGDSIFVSPSVCNLANELSSQISLGHSFIRNPDNGKWNTQEISQLLHAAQDILSNTYGCKYDSKLGEWGLPTKGDKNAALIAIKMYRDIRQQVQDDYFPGKTDPGHRKAIKDANKLLHQHAERTSQSQMMQEILDCGRRASMQPGSMSSSSAASYSYSGPSVSSLPGVHII